MILHPDYFPWIKELNDYVRVKDVFILHKELSMNPEEEHILSLTQRGIVIKDKTSNEGQLPESYNKYNLIYPKDIVLNPMDLITGWVDVSKYKGLISPSYKTLRLINQQENIDYYCYQFQRYYLDKLFFKFGEGVSYDYRWGINNDILMNFPIKRIPISEQNRVVDEIKSIKNSISSNIEKLQGIIDEQKTMRVQLLKEFF